MSTSAIPAGLPYCPPQHVQEELSYQPTPGWQPPRDSYEVFKLNIRQHKLAVAAMVIALPATLVIGAGVLEHYNGFFSAHLFPPMANGSLMGSKTKDTPPAVGPIDIERGYDRIADWRKTFAERDGDFVTPQQEWIRHYLVPPVGTLYTGHPIPPVFDRPMQAGGTIVDAMGHPLLEMKSPYRVYSKYEDIPPLLANMMAFAEDKNIISPDKPATFNRAINLPRTVKAVGEKMGSELGIISGRASGGSGLKVQTYKNQAYYKGQTGSGSQKLEQYAGASVSMYADGPDTRERGQYALTEYMNMVPFGRWRGFNDGMAYWFGNDTYNETLRGNPNDPNYPVVVRQLLTLITAVQQPSDILVRVPSPEQAANIPPARLAKNEADWKEAQNRLDTVLLPGLVAEGHLTPELAARIKAVKLNRADLARNPIRPPVMIADKTINSLTIDLARKLDIKGEDSIYKLGSMQVRAESSLIGDISDRILAKLDAARDPVEAKKMGLTGGKYLLPEQSKPYDIDVAITIKQVEPGNHANTRVSADTSKGEHDVSRTGKQNTGSTNKPIMYTSMLELGYARLYDELKGKTPAELAALEVNPKDSIKRWTVDYLQAHQGNHSLQDLLETVGNREYSGAKACWYTGESMFCPDNFERKNYGMATLYTTLARSLNLPSVRFTSDLVEHIKWHTLGFNPRALDSSDPDPVVGGLRRAYLTQFSLYESERFQARAYVAIRKSPEINTARLASGYFATTQAPDFKGLQEHLAKSCSRGNDTEESGKVPCLTDEKQLRAVYEAYRPTRTADVDSLLAAPLAGKPDQMISLYRALHPRADYTEARRFVSYKMPDLHPLANLRSAYAAAKPDASLDKTHQLTQEVLAVLPKGAKPEEYVLAIYGQRHPGSTRLATAEFLNTYCADCANKPGFVELHRRYVADTVTDTTPLETARLLARQSRKQSDTARATLLFSVWPQANFDQMSDFLAAEAKKGDALTDKRLRELYEQHAPRKAAPLADLLATTTDRKPTTLIALYRDLNPAATYAETRQFIGRMNPGVSPFADLNPLFNAYRPDLSPERTAQLASLIDLTSTKPDDPDAARAWYSPDEQLAALQSHRNPGQDYAATKAFIRHYNKKAPAWADFRELHKRYATAPEGGANEYYYRFNLMDRQMLAGVHPLALEAGRLTAGDPTMTLDRSLQITAPTRLAIYDRQLVNPKKLTPRILAKQDRAIQTMMEKAAFRVINNFWATLGYPYRLKDTLANVISAAHRLEDLAVFNSIIANGGRAVKSTSFTAVHAGERTPFELHSRTSDLPDTQVMHPEVAAHVYKAMRGSVETPEGTGRRLAGVFKRDDGVPYAVTYKSGTSADASTGSFRGAFGMGTVGGCLAFSIGFYKYNATAQDRFTSALPAQMLKNLAPEFEEILKRFPCKSPVMYVVPGKPLAAGAPLAAASSASAPLPASAPEVFVAPTAAAATQHEPPKQTSPSLNWNTLGLTGLLDGALDSPAPLDLRHPVRTLSLKH